MKSKPSHQQLEPPVGLSGESKILWKEITQSRARTPERLALLHQALIALDRANQAAALVEKEGMVLVTKRTGVAHSNPALKIERENRALFVRIWGGMLNLTWNHDDIF